ncbi:TonB-dependent receptor plug domain-containing protein [Verrucomicrobium sp. GAS474]|uniref:TonB-dependent receptor n=1 Tax=Verrucomicrobium sp. GAS474 TaxID=1882831 RepID=UPI00138FE3B9|nr:TonB-dependent receptor plug domain-containing protein [Verrucomicrobium sp. GAS474]
MAAMGVDTTTGPLTRGVPDTILQPTVVTAQPDSDLGGETLSSLQLRDLNVTSAQDLTALSPNVTSLDGGAHSFNSIMGSRGLMNSLYFTDPTLVLYVDDVPFTNSYANHLNSDSIATLNILKGPQGSSFGHNGSAGVIEVKQVQPTDFWTATSNNEYGSHEHYKTFEQVSGPLSKDVSFLASTRYEQRDGYLKNVTLNTHPDGQQDLQGRVALRWQPTTRLSFDLNLEQEEGHDGVQRFVPLSGPRYQIATQVDGKNDIQSNLQSLKTTYDAEEFQVLFITSHRLFDLSPNRTDLGFGGSPILSEIDIQNNQYVQELRIRSKNIDSFHWFAGVSYEHVTIEPNTAQVFSGGVSTFSRTHQTNNGYASFGQIEFCRLEKLTIQVGGRIELDERSGNRAYVDTSGNRFFDRQDRQYLNAATTINGTYTISDHHSILASSGLTFRPGSFAPFAGATTLEPYGSEKTWANSIGWQVNALEKRLTSTVSAFWNKTYDYQLERYTFPLVDVVNIPAVSSRGIEWNLEGKPLKELTLQAGVGFTLATFDSYHDGVTGQSYARNRVPYVPEETFLLGATYRHSTGWMMHVDYRGIGQTYFEQSNNPLYEQPAYGLLAAKIGYETKHWSLYVYGENLAETRYATLIDSGLQTQVPGDPRTVGIGLDLSW